MLPPSRPFRARADSGMSFLHRTLTPSPSSKTFRDEQSVYRRPMRYTGGWTTAVPRLIRKRQP